MTRVLACLAIGAWVFLLWPFPITTFMATCMACVTYPAYRKLHRKMSPSWAMTTYTVGLAAITILPIATVVSLVTPQAVAGLKILDGLRDSGWIHSPEAQAWFASVDAWLKNLPGLEGGLDQLASTAAGLAGTAARTVLAGGVGIAGGAFQAVLVLFLFVMITMMCVTRADLIHEFACRLTQWPAEVIDRFVSTIRKPSSASWWESCLSRSFRGSFAVWASPSRKSPNLRSGASLPRSWLPSLLSARLSSGCRYAFGCGSRVHGGLHRPCHLVCAGRSRGGQPASPLLPEDGDRRVGRYADPLHPLRPRRVWAGRRLRGAGARRRRHSGRQREYPLPQALSMMTP